MEANAGDSLRDQVVLITGGSRGIGKALAKAFTLAGAQVVLTARSQIDLDRVATAIRQQGGHCLGQAADVSRASDVQALVNAAVGRFGRIDTLINNAGVSHDNRPLYRLDEASWDQVMDVNLKGSFLCCKYVIPHMRPNHSGCIINLSSDLGRETPRWGAYGISKWAIDGLTILMAKELQSARIRVHSVSPGVVATGMTKYAGRNPEGVTSPFLYLSSDRARRITGKLLHVERWEKQLGLAQNR